MNSTLFLFLILSSSAFSLAQSQDEKLPAKLIDQAKLLGLAKEQQWLDLLHIRPNALLLKRSQALPGVFFLSPAGYYNPEAEMNADLEGLFKDPHLFPVNEHPLCRFPARKRWLQDKLKISASAFPRANCPMYDGYIRRLSAKAVSVVFSSYYSDSPGSAFGHTLFRISKSESASQEHNELLDYGIGFAANASPEVNPLIYALGGLLGGFSGTFANVPYYYKVREYNSFESRDLWSYDLNLSQPEVDFFIDHLWEVGDNPFSYYFFTQNCGLHILSTLDASVPRIHLVDRVPLWVIPADSVRAIAAEPGLVKKVTYRPSIKSQALYEYSLLSPEDKSLFRQWVQGDNIRIFGNSVALHDLALDYFDFKNADLNSDRNKEDPRFNIRHALLSQRASLGQVSPELNMPVPQDLRPDLGHTTTRTEISRGYDQLLSNFTDFDFRFSLHDLLDPRAGYPEGAQIEFWNFRIRTYDASNTAELERFDFFKMATIMPSNEFQKTMAWTANLYAGRIDDFRCADCFAEGASFGYGKSWDLSQTHGKNILYILMNGDLSYSAQFQPAPLLAMVGPQVNLRLLLTANWNAQFIARQDAQLFSFWQQGSYLGLETRYNVQTNITLVGRTHKTFSQSQIYDGWSTGLLWYF